MLPVAVKNLIVKIAGSPLIKVPAQKVCRCYVRHKYGFNGKFVVLGNSASGSGDALYLLSFLENASGMDYRIFLTPGTRDAGIASLFPALRDRFLYVSKFIGLILFLFASDIGIHSFPKKSSEYFLDGRFSFFPAGLSTNRKVKIENSDKEVFALFHQLSCKRRKTVLISPHSGATPVNASDEYWTRYAEELEKRGYVPVFNSSKKFGSFESIFLGYRETVLFAALSGNIIGIRSGLLDILLYFTNAKAIVFYPAEPVLTQEKFISNFWDNPTKRLMEYFSLKKIHPDKDIQEYFFCNEHVSWGSFTAPFLEVTLDTSLTSHSTPHVARSERR